jgi:nitroimidazol reductase NimA-like FMN-containing flavoprotein (pyridoxamine 5'-phosphate oxidase superfamily)
MPGAGLVEGYRTSVALQALNVKDEHGVSAVQGNASDQQNLMYAVSELLRMVDHATIATVSADGRPWNTPVYFARQGRSLYWTSRTDAKHSRNVRHNSHAFIVVYDSSREDCTGGAAYIEAAVTELLDDIAVETGLRLIYRRRGTPAPSIGHFSGSSPHRIYRATAVRIWTNVLHTSNTICWDERVEIALNDE